MPSSVLRRLVKDRPGDGQRVVASVLALLDFLGQDAGELLAHKGRFAVGPLDA